MSVASCRDCGSEFPSALTAEGLCPACLFQLGQAIVDVPQSAPVASGSNSAIGWRTPSFDIGTQLGPYQIIALIGGGGMGHVYKAWDRRLLRTVAIKVFSPRLSGHASTEARLEAEARIIAQLHHTHICSLFDIGDHDGMRYLVMEYLEGETLAQRLTRGPLTIDDAVTYSTHIAEALSSAHGRGIIHRDLKPGNVVLTDAGAKLVDFGLAKLAFVDLAARATDDGNAGAHRPLRRSLSGTLQYMSPEQLEGKETDARSDLFSLGLILYEMLAGPRVYAEHAALECNAGRFVRHIEFAKLPPDTPDGLKRLVEECLASDPDERPKTAADVLARLEALEADHQGAHTPRTRLDTWAGRKTVWIAAAVIASGCTLAVAARWPTVDPTRNSDLVRFTLVPPRPPGGIGAPRGFAFISPDGRQLAWVVANGEGGTSLAVQRFDSKEVLHLKDADDARFPFWSPDSLSIAFFSGPYLKRVSASGGAVHTIAPAPLGQGGTWNREGVILFAPDAAGSIHRVDAGGGTPARVTTLSRELGETAHQWPTFLSDGRHFVYLVLSSDSNRRGLWIGDLNSPLVSRLCAADSGAVHAAPDEIAFTVGSALFSASVDIRPEGARLRRPPVLLQRPVHVSGKIGPPYFSVSAEGTLIYHTLNVPKADLVWMDRSGRTLSSIGSPELQRDPALSPNGDQIAITRMDPQDQILRVWLMDPRTGRSSRLTANIDGSSSALWSPDAVQLVLASNTGEVNSLYRIEPNGSNHQLLVRSATTVQPTDWSHDGKFVLYETNGQAAKREIWVLPMTPGGRASPYLQGRLNEREGRFSPDGRFIVYSSDDTGNYEVYVTTFPRPTRRWQVSVAGGSQPMWRRDGRELFFLSLSGDLMSVAVTATEGAIRLGQPSKLFTIPRGEKLGSRNSYTVADDGHRFLFTIQVNDLLQQRLVANVLRNWRSAVHPG